VAKIEVKQVRATMTLTDSEPRWEVVVSYGPNDEIVIPLPARELAGDDWSQSYAESLAAMERLAGALFDFVVRIRTSRPNDLS
jgi:hypothetical protein